ncbi:hypothetical protein MJG50_18925 [Fredinandcohnia sp. SECRCQ15]|uniref:Uncharacterized protein n=1 Tax=Fredinandcohnia quinoae TaxID=2918902 RepID=A0AAW5E4J2_9BACI|nr:hypothetical protein [Fredinandcohnia sp. SECRCQ15]
MRNVPLGICKCGFELKNSNPVFISNENTIFAKFLASKIINETAGFKNNYLEEMNFDISVYLITCFARFIKSAQKSNLSSKEFNFLDISQFNN